MSPKVDVAKNYATAQIGHGAGVDAWLNSLAPRAGYLSAHPAAPAEIPAYTKLFKDYSAISLKFI